MSARLELLQIIARLDVISHVPAMNQAPKDAVGGPTTSEGSQGGNRPRGGVDRRDDRDRESDVAKSADHYRWRLGRCHTERDYRDARDAALRTLQSFTHTPIPNEPAYGSPMWKRWIADSKESNADLARRFNCSREHIRQVRAREGVVGPSRGA